MLPWGGRITEEKKKKTRKRRRRRTRGRRRRKKEEEKQKKKMTRRRSVSHGHGPELKGQYVNVARRQLPLGPARVLPLYSMQGMTAEPGLGAHWTFPPRLDYDIK